MLGCLAVELGGQGNYSSYYDNTQNRNEKELRDSLKSIISNGYRSFSYGAARDKMFMEHDNLRVNGGGAAVNTLECAYTGRIVAGYANRSEAQNSTNNFNTEHTWPQSLFGSASPMQGDMHHLFAVDETSNTVRSNNPFGLVPNPTTTLPGGSKYGGNVFEPRDVQKGPSAKAMCYFVLRYQDYNNFFAPQESILRKWALAYPSTPAQITRNTAIFNSQRNRNPFVDYPQLLERMGSLVGATSAPVAVAAGKAFPDRLITDIDNPVGVLRIVAANMGNQAITYSAALALGNQGISLIDAANQVPLPIGAASTIALLARVSAQFATDTLVVTFSNGATAISTQRIPVRIDATLAVRTNLASLLKLYPQPAHQSLHIVWPSKAALGTAHTATLQDIAGRTVAQYPIAPSEQQTLDISQLPPGIYTLSLPGKGSAKVVVQ